MRHCSVESRLRPIRLAMLIPAGDFACLDRAIVANTCLWGGKFNPIIPVPMNPDDPSWSSFSISKSLLTFEPDFLVSCSNSIEADCFGIPKITMDELWAELYRPAIGAGVLPLYMEAFESEYQFISNLSRKVYLPQGNGSFDYVVRATFGGFNQEDFSQWTSSKYRSLFSATVKSFTEEELLTTSSKGMTTPLDFASKYLKVDHPDWPIETWLDQLLVIDHEDIDSIVTLWNLRALGWRFVTATKRLFAEWPEFLPRMIAENYLSVVTDEKHIEDVKRKLSETVLADTTRLSSVTKLLEAHVGTPSCRGNIHSLTQQVELSIKPTAEISFDIVRLSENLIPISQFGYANVINISLLPDKAKLSLPPVMANVDLTPLLSPSTVDTRTPRRIHQNSEGFVVLEGWRDEIERWKIPTPHETWEWYVSQRGGNSTATFTGKGRIAENLIGTLGGLEGMKWLKSFSVLKVLDQLAHGMREFDQDDDLIVVGMQRKRIAYPRMLTRSDWINRVLHPDEDNVWQLDETDATETLDALINLGVLRAGAKVKCTHCSRWSWYLIDVLSEALRCDHCLEQYSFPKRDPSNKAFFEWCYRPQGPFSIENLAQGQYSIALSLSFLAQILRTPFAWVAESNIEIDCKSHEIDFLLWNSEEGSSYRQYERPLLAFGECKSFNESLKQADFDRLEHLATNFADSTFIVSTLAKKFGTREKQRLKKFGRDYNVRLIVLTAHELLRPIPSAALLKAVGTQVAETTEVSSPEKTTLRFLSERTSELYLS